MASKKPALTLYRGLPTPSNYIWSPFVTKLEARLRFAGVPYVTAAGSLSKAPKGKVPYVEVRKPGQGEEAEGEAVVLSDSSLIAERLVEDGVLGDLNARLGARERVEDWGVRALLEERLYFLQGYEKWHDNYYEMRSYILSSMPRPMQVVIGQLIYRKHMRTFQGQGTGRFSAEELRKSRRQIWEGMEGLLVEAKRKARQAGAGDGEVFWALGGKEPTEVDTVLYGFIVAVLICTAMPESLKVVRGLPTVAEYAKRIHEKYFPDYIGWE